MPWLEYRVREVEEGQRLDRLLRSSFEDLGLRAWRRLIIKGLVQVNGRQANSSLKVRHGDLVSFNVERKSPALGCATPSLLANFGNWYFLAKPACLHTVSLAGGISPSLEDFLPEICAKQGLSLTPNLVQRLDYGTSGLVLACKGKEEEVRFKQAERQGLVVKKYSKPDFL